MPLRQSLFVISAAWLALALTGCGSRGDDATDTAKPAMTVTTTEIRPETWPQTLDAHGQIAAWHEAQVSARVAGLPLVEVRVDVGDRVKRGELLARFDDRPVRADLAQAQASLAQAAANARQALANRDRAVKLQPSGALSEQDLQQQQTQLDAAEAQRALAAAQVTSQEIRLQDCEVRAVDDGVISARSASLGQVAQGGAELFRLIRGERLEWRAELSATQLLEVKLGQSVTLTLPDGSSAEGSVRQVAPALDSDSRLGLAYVDVKPGSGARVAMYASGHIVVAQTPALVVPAEAVVLRDGRSSVFLIDTQDAVRQVAVDVGRRDRELIEVRGALQAGDVVAVRGAGFLNQGDRVRRAESDRRIEQDDRGQAGSQ